MRLRAINSEARVVFLETALSIKQWQCSSSEHFVS
jgi:hypothetical protein